MVSILESGERVRCDIRISGLTFSYGAHTVLRDLSLTLPTTGVTRLTGANGVGKTTLLKLLGGVLAPKVQAVDPPQIRFLYIDRDFLSLNYLTVSEMVDFGYSLAGTGATSLDAYDLIPVAMRETRVLALSLGQQQRLVLALAAILPCDVLLLDEPFNGLDQEGRAAAVDLVGRISAGRHVLFSAHDEGGYPHLVGAAMHLVAPDVLECHVVPEP